MFVSGIPGVDKPPDYSDGTEVDPTKPGTALPDTNIPDAGAGTTEPAEPPSAPPTDWGTPGSPPTGAPASPPTGAPPTEAPAQPPAQPPGELQRAWPGHAICCH